MAKRLETERLVAGRAAGRDAADSRARDRATEFGPLRVFDDGVEWDGVFYPWAAIRSYEVASGYLNIVPAGGRDFVRRLAELGDPAAVLARLDAAIGGKRVVPLVRGR